MNMLWSTEPTKLLKRGESLKKDIANFEKVPKKSKIFEGLNEDSVDGGNSIFTSKILSPRVQGRYVAELAWHK